MTSSDWYKIDEVEENIFILEEPHHVQSYLVNSRTHSALIDTGTGFRNIRNAIKHILRDKVIVLNTHWHFDHVGGNVLFGTIAISGTEARLIERSLDNKMMMEIYIKPSMDLGITFPDDFLSEVYEIKGSKASFFIEDGDRIDLGERALEVISVPGHTHGSLAFLDNRTRSLFSGDFIYKAELYAHLEDSDMDEYIDSLIKLKQRSSEFNNIYPGHGEYPLTKAFIDSVLSGFEKIKSGAAPYKIIENMGTKAQFYQFHGFSVFLKAPGEAGAIL